jgi:capsule polysaccharide export protein KpsE/RkpR
MAHQEADQRLAFLEKEQNQASQNMFKAEEALKCYSEQSGVLQIDAQTKGVLEYIASLRAAIDSTEVKLLVMRQQATPYNYDLIRIETELNALKGKLRAAEEKSKDNSLCGESSIAKGEMPSLELEYLRLFRDVKFQDGLLQLYTRLVELARIDKARSAEIIHVVDKATVPGRKSSPKRLLTTVLVSMCTFFMMIFVAFIRERWQRMSAQPENAQRLTILMDYLEPWFRPFIHLFHSIRKKVKFKY